MRYVLLLLAVACVPTYHFDVIAPKNYPLPEPRTLAVSLDTLWPAIVDVVNEWQLVIKLVDKSSGLLQSERMWGGDIDAYWDCGQDLMIVTYDPKSPYERRDSTITRRYPDAMVTITVSAVPRGVGTTLRITANVSGGCVSKGRIEGELLDAIEKRWTELRR